jgi:hypothetical protein
VSEADTGARSLFGLHKRAPKRPQTVTIILAIVVGFLLLSGPRELDEQAAIRSFQAYVGSGMAQNCGAIAGFSQASVSRVETGSGKLERYDIRQEVSLAMGSSLELQAYVWPGIRIGPRFPIGEERYATLFQFDDGVELVQGELRC